MKVSIKDLETYKELHRLAMEKGLFVLTGRKGSFLHQNITDTDEIGYAVVKRIGGIDFSVSISGDIYYDYFMFGPEQFWTIWFRYSLTEAIEIVKNFDVDENSAEFPRFYGFIRVYEDENKKSSYEMQRLLLEHWAEKQNIQFEEIFGCIGGYEQFQGEPANIMETENIVGIECVMHSCNESFNKFKHNDVLCVTALDRLDGFYKYWEENFIVLDTREFNECTLYPYKQIPTQSENAEEKCPF